MSLPSALPRAREDVQPRLHVVQCPGDHQVCEGARSRSVRHAEPWLVLHVTGSHCVIRLASVRPWELSKTARRGLQVLFADLGVAGALDDRSRVAIGLTLAVFVVPASVGPSLLNAVAERAHFQNVHSLA